MKEVIDTVSVALANGDTENVGNVVMQEVNVRCSRQVWMKYGRTK